MQLADRYRGVVAWSKLPDYLGSRLDAAELSAFLDTSPRGYAWLRNAFDKDYYELLATTPGNTA